MFKQKRLKSGLTLITAPIKRTMAAAVLVMVGTGSKYEDKRLNGMSHFLEHLFFKGTKRRPTPLALASEMDSTGGDFNAFTTKECTGYWLKVDAAKIVRALDLVSDMLINSKFEAAELEREKGVIIEEINMYKDNPMIYIEDVFEKLLYGETPAGRATQGEKQTVAGFKRRDFIEYFSSQYQPRNSLVVLAGKINSSAAQLAEKYFAGFAQKHDWRDFKEKPAVKVGQKAPAVAIEFKKTDQAHLSLGVHAPLYGSKEEIALKLLAIALGGSMSARLFMELRERRGLAYYVRTQYEPYTDSGYLTTQAGVPLERTEESIRVILGEYKKIADKTIAAKELKRVKDYLIGKLRLRLESSDDLAGWYARQAVLKLTQERQGLKSRAKIYTPEEFIRKIGSATAEEIARAARRIFSPEKFNLAVIGPFRDKNNFNRLLKL